MMEDTTEATDNDMTDIQVESPNLLGDIQVSTSLIGMSSFSAPAETSHSLLEAPFSADNVQAPPDDTITTATSGDLLGISSETPQTSVPAANNDPFDFLSMTAPTAVTPAPVDIGAVDLLALSPTEQSGKVVPQEGTSADESVLVSSSNVEAVVGITPAEIEGFTSTEQKDSVPASPADQPKEQVLAVEDQPPAEGGQTNLVVDLQTTDPAVQEKEAPQQNPLQSPLSEAFETINLVEVPIENLEDVQSNPVASASENHATLQQEPMQTDASQEDPAQLQPEQPKTEETGHLEVNSHPVDSTGDPSTSEKIVETPSTLANAVTLVSNAGSQDSAASEKNVETPSTSANAASLLSNAGSQDSAASEKNVETPSTLANADTVVSNEGSQDSAASDKPVETPSTLLSNAGSQNSATCEKTVETLSTLANSSTSGVSADSEDSATSKNKVETPSTLASASTLAPSTPESNHQELKTSHVAEKQETDNSTKESISQVSKEKGDLGEERAEAVTTAEEGCRASESEENKTSSSSEKPVTTDHETSKEEPVTQIDVTAYINTIEDLKKNLEEERKLREHLEVRERTRIATVSELRFNLETETRSRSDAEKRVFSVEELLRKSKSRLREEMAKLAETENKKNSVQDQLNKTKKSLETLGSTSANTQKELQERIRVLEEDKKFLQVTVDKEKAEKDESLRKERALANRLNLARKKESAKVDREELFQDDIRLLAQESENAKKELEQLKAERKKESEEWQTERVALATRVQKLSKSLKEEKGLAEERKQKMKAFVETKTEEIQQSKTENEELRNEVHQTSRSLFDLNQRWKQLHAQWVQSQTRNRELQRDLNKLKKDAENFHKVGGTLEMRLSQSANETEQHKNKRMAAKNELMIALKTLEAERENGRKLRDSIRFTFAPKAQSQQQLLRENLESFQIQLESLARRLSQPPPLLSAEESDPFADLWDASDTTDNEETELNEEEEGDSREQTRARVEASRLLAKLDTETQRVSRGIMALSARIEKLQHMVDTGGSRSCLTSLGTIFSGSAAPTLDETEAMTGARPTNRGRGKYNQVSSSQLT